MPAQHHRHRVPTAVEHHSVYVEDWKRGSKSLSTLMETRLRNHGGFFKSRGHQYGIVYVVIICHGWEIGAEDSPNRCQRAQMPQRLRPEVFKQPPCKRNSRNPLRQGCIPSTKLACELTWRGPRATSKLRTPCRVLCRTCAVNCSLERHWRK